MRTEPDGLPPSPTQQPRGLQQVFSLLGDGKTFSEAEYQALPDLIQSINQRYATVPRLPIRQQFKTSELLPQANILIPTQIKPGNLEHNLALFIHLLNLYNQFSFDIREQDSSIIIDLPWTLASRIRYFLMTMQTEEEWSEFVRILCLDTASLNLLVLGLLLVKPVENEDSSPQRLTWLKYINQIEKCIQDKYPLYLGLLQKCYEFYFEPQCDLSFSIWSIITSNPDYAEEKSHLYQYIPFQLVKMTLLCQYYSKETPGNLHDDYPSLMPLEYSPYEIQLQTFLLLSFGATWTQKQCRLTLLSREFSKYVLIRFGVEENLPESSFQHEGELIAQLFLSYLIYSNFSEPEILPGLYSLFIRLDSASQALLYEKDPSKFKDVFLKNLAEEVFPHAVDLYSQDYVKKTDEFAPILALRLVFYLKSLNELSLGFFIKSRPALKVEILKLCLKWIESIAANNAMPGIIKLFSEAEHDEVNKVIQDPEILSYYSAFVHFLFLENDFHSAHQFFARMVVTPGIVLKQPYGPFKFALYSTFNFIETWIKYPRPLSGEERNKLIGWQVDYQRTLLQVYDIQNAEDMKQLQAIILRVYVLLNQLIETQVTQDLHETHQFLFSTFKVFLTDNKATSQLNEAFKKKYPLYSSAQESKKAHPIPDKSHAVNEKAKRAKALQERALFEARLKSEAAAREEKAKRDQVEQEKRDKAKRAQEAQVNAKKNKPKKTGVISVAAKPKEPLTLDLTSLPSFIQTLPQLLELNCYLSGVTVWNLMQGHTPDYYRVVCPNLNLESASKKFSPSDLLQTPNALYVKFLLGTKMGVVEIVSIKKTKSWDDKEAIKEDAIRQGTNLFTVYLPLKMDGPQELWGYRFEVTNKKLGILQSDALKKQTALIMADQTTDSIPTYPLQKCFAAIQWLKVWVNYPHLQYTKTIRMLVVDGINELIAACKIPNYEEQSSLQFMLQQFEQIYFLEPRRIMRAMEKLQLLEVFSDKLLTQQEVLAASQIIPVEAFSLEALILAISAVAIRDKTASQLPESVVLLRKAEQKSRIRQLTTYTQPSVDTSELPVNMPDWLEPILRDCVPYKPDQVFLDRNKLPGQLLDFIVTLQQKYPEISFYLVGGAVLDTYLDQRPNDYDLLCEGLTITQLDNLLTLLDIPHTCVNASHPVISLNLTDDTGETISLDLSVLAEETLQEDYAKRLFNISALRIDLSLSKNRLVIEGDKHWQQGIIATIEEAHLLLQNNPWSILRLMLLQLKYPDFKVENLIIEAWSKQLPMLLSQSKQVRFPRQFTANLGKLLARFSWEDVLEKLQTWQLLQPLTGLNFEEAKDALKVIPPSERSKPTVFLFALIAYAVFIQHQSTPILLASLLGIAEEDRPLLAYLNSFIAPQYYSLQPTEIPAWLTKAYPPLEFQKSVESAKVPEGILRLVRNLTNKLPSVDCVLEGTGVFDLLAKKQECSDLTLSLYGVDFRTLDHVLRETGHCPVLKLSYPLLPQDAIILEVQGQVIRLNCMGAVTDLEEVILAKLHDHLLHLQSLALWIKANGSTQLFASPKTLRYLHLKTPSQQQMNPHPEFDLDAALNLLTVCMKYNCESLLLIDELKRWMNINLSEKLWSNDSLWSLWLEQRLKDLGLERVLQVFNEFDLAEKLTRLNNDELRQAIKLVPETEQTNYENFILATLAYGAVHCPNKMKMSPMLIQKGLSTSSLQRRNFLWKLLDDPGFRLSLTPVKFPSWLDQYLFSIPTLKALWDRRSPNTVIVFDRLFFERTTGKELFSQSLDFLVELLGIERDKALLYYEYVLKTFSWERRGIYFMGLVTLYKNLYQPQIYPDLYSYMEDPGYTFLNYAKDPYNAQPSPDTSFNQFIWETMQQWLQPQRQGATFFQKESSTPSEPVYAENLPSKH